MMMDHSEMAGKKKALFSLRTILGNSPPNIVKQKFGNHLSKPREETEVKHLEETTCYIMYPKSRLKNEGKSFSLNSQFFLKDLMLIPQVHILNNTDYAIIQCALQTSQFK